MNKTKLLTNPHPGDILREDFLSPMGLSQYRLAKDTGIAHSGLTRILQCAQSITPEVDARLSRYFGLSRGYWLGLQMDYDVMEFDRRHAARIAMEVRPLAWAG